MILCEDPQHEAFARRFLKQAGFEPRHMRIERAPNAKGSAEQYVRTHFPRELREYRLRRHRIEQALVVVVDPDTMDPATRVEQLEAAAANAGQDRRQPGERVAIFVPRRNIETWIAYLDGKTVDETKSYPKLDRQRDCQSSVETLHRMCQQRTLRQPAPESLTTACAEYHRRLQLSTGGSSIS